MRRNHINSLYFGNKTEAGGGRWPDASTAKKRRF
jgi:hypothetical protein